MVKLLTDVHTHSAFSHDGISSADEMMRTAKENGLKYFGLLEHMDYSDGRILAWTDPQYFQAEREMAKVITADSDMEILIGAEFSQVQSEDFFNDPSPVKNEPYFNAARATIEKYRPDFVVNSVHSRPFIENNSKPKAYERYLREVLLSLDAPFEYDIIAHLGYCERYASYEDKKFYYAEFKDLFDEIFKKIIEKGKILEVNGKSSENADCAFCPNEEILTAYFKAGGRKVSYASDAHDTSSIMQNRDKVVKTLKKIGFEYLTVPVRGTHIKVEI